MSGIQALLMEQIVKPSASQFIAYSAFTSAGRSPTPSSLGAVAGDLALVLGSIGNSPASGSGRTWASISGPGGMYFYALVLQLPDVTNIVSRDAGCNLFIYRGPNQIVSQSSGSTSTGATYPATISGFAKSSGHVGLLGITHTDKNNGSTNNVATIASPSGFLQRAVNKDYNSSPSYLGSFRFSDRLYPDSPYYIDNTSFTYNGYSTPAGGGIGHGPGSDALAIYELIVV